MYLKSLKIKNFRKFGEDNNLIEFVDSKGLEDNTINIASVTTLIVGKNNSGKTTITKALDKIIYKKKFEANDFNFSYLNRLLDEYKENTYDKFPELEFELKIGIDDSNDSSFITNIVPFLKIEDVDATEFSIKIKYELSKTKEIEFKDEIKNIISNYSNDKYIIFQKYLELLNNTDKQLNYYNFDDEVIEKNKFKLSDLMQIKIIEANKPINDTSLSRIFNKIIQYKYKTQENSNINQQIETINTNITEEVKSNHTPHINGALCAIANKLEVRLSSKLDFDILMNQMIRYEYVEQELNIPEGQFGLGYSNLMTIIGKIIDYIEKYPDEKYQSKLNLICIEEPEAFMHPQMQELFIKHINDAIKYLLDGRKINSQLIITTHSAHILNSKIHTSDSFNNINYMTIINNLSNVVNLKDSNIVDREDENNLKFIKKHIKHKVSELFFSDAIIFVEGITEETLLNYYIDNDDDLYRYYISIFNINGAHGLVYHNLIKLLKIPTLIITDLDIKRNESEKGERYKENGKNKIGEFIQITNLNGRKTTNATVIKYNKYNKYNKDDISNIPTHFEDENLYLTFQSQKIGNYYATSLEEAYILKNYDNDILNKVLKKLKPRIYKDIVGKDEDRNNLKDNSYKLQSKLSNSKSDFANELLDQFSNKKDNEKIPDLPEYIENAISWLKGKLI